MRARGDVGVPDMRLGAFDHAAEDYDQKRGFPPGISELVAEAALELLPGGRAARVLEVGVGTGRIARPLLARGVAMTGLDLSRAMMERLLATLPQGARQPGLILGSAEALPLAAGQFEAVAAVHVLHLLGQWRTALAEARRVLAPGGVVLAGYDWRAPDSPSARLMDNWRAIVRARGLAGDSLAGAVDYADIKAALLAGGAVCEERQVGEWRVRRSLAHQLETIEHRTWSATWPVPAGFFGQCLRELRAWALAEFGALDEELEVTHRFVWQRFSWPPNHV